MEDNKNTFSGQRILMVCQETFTFPFHFLSRRWIDNNELAAFFFAPTESKLAECQSNAESFYRFPRFDGKLKIYTSDKMSEEYEKILYSKELIDKEFLDYIEKNYTHYLGVNEQLVTSQMTSRHYHYRIYYLLMTYEQQLNWLILTYKNMINILDDFKPNMVLDCNCAEIWRPIMRELCYARHIPYIAPTYPRVEMFVLPSFTLGYKIDDYFKKGFESNLNLNEHESQEEIDYIHHFKKRSNIMAEMYKNDVTSQYKPDGIVKSLRFLASVAKSLVKQNLSGKNYAIKKTNPYLYPKDWLFWFYFVKKAYYKQILMRKNKYFKSPVEGERYVYMPLHLIPESSTFVLAPFYVNELNIVEAVSKSLPAGWVLYVKEHQAMVGERPVEFYEKVNRLPNAKMVQLNYYTDPKPWIIKSEGVITISGTSAYEAAMLGKRSIVFSDVPFRLIEGVTRVRSFEDLPSVINKFTDPLNNEKSCAVYLKTVKEYGEEINIKYLLNHCPEYIRGQKSEDGELKKNIDHLEKMFVKAYDIYKRFNKADGPGAEE